MFYSTVNTDYGVVLVQARYVKISSMEIAAGENPCAFFELRHKNLNTKPEETEGRA